MPIPILDRISKLDKVLILGFAREGRSTYSFLRSRFSNLKIGLADQKHPQQIPQDPNTETFFGKKYLNSLKNHGYQLVFKSPGISPHLSPIVRAAKSGVHFTSHTQLFFELCPTKNLIGVTGTKGKSTTASLIHHVLSRNGVQSQLVGNIGQPALDFLPQITPQTWVVIELSSYQLMDLSVSPHIAVLQNIYPDHLDYHKSLREYTNAKANIARFQTPEDYFIYNADNPPAAKIARLTPARRLPYHLPDPSVPTKLIGLHNQYNLMPALLIGQLLNIPQDKILTAVESFTPLETRLQSLAEKNGIKFYSDPLATIPEATIAAISALHPATLIAGGHERRQKYAALIKKILTSDIQTLILFPATGQRINDELVLAKEIYPNVTLPKAFLVNSMEEAVRLAFQHTPAGSVCLLSPAAPSFTLFKDYRDEHRQYQMFIEQYHTSYPIPTAS